MKNLFKTLITVVTVICMLSSMTAFAASQTTVTQYVSGTNVNVITTVSGVGADVIVTYLVANDVNDNDVADAAEIKYINQTTSDGGDVVFSYSITDDTMTVATAIADVQFGSDDADTAAALNDDKVIFDDIDFVVKDTNGDVIEHDGAELSQDYYIGKGDTRTDVVISALPGYKVTAVKIGETVYTAETLQAAYPVAYGQAVEVTVDVVSEPTVYLFTDATVEDGLEIYDQDDNKLYVKTGIGMYVGGKATSAAIVFDGCDIDGNHHEDFTYEATVSDPEATSGYFAVQLASADEADLAPATQACAVINGAPVYSAN